MGKHTPWWFPERTDSGFCKRIRDDYPESADMSDDELIEYYADGQKYATTWDHIGDAYEEYEPLVDSYLELLAFVEEIVTAGGRYSYHSYLNETLIIADAYKLLRKARGEDNG